ncbi:MAG: helix-hairpin-helix domain-containing protein [Bacteroidales bacterium]|nr:helix-hairpin-helix domain-containing protein [Bacteroidales bacterium]
MERKSRRTKNGNSEPSSVFKAGAVSLAFLIIGYQAALFVHKAAELHIAALRDSPDTVYVYVGRSDTLIASKSDSSLSAGTSGLEVLAAGRRNSVHHPRVEAVRKHTRRVESFRFNPNTAGQEELMRLGFSEKQAVSIISYREKGGRFRRPSDFARSYVVADSVYRRLEAYIDIPLIDINKADSAAFETLPGIGPYFAAAMVRYRERLGGYSYKEQLLDIYRFDREKFDGLSDLICCSRPKPFRLWSLGPDSLRLHPYIKDWQAARSIVLFRENTPTSEWSVEALAAAGIITDENASKLGRCVIEEPHLPGGGQD